jgi:glycosyltransferase involved in cell wall biosynthesis
VAHYPRQISRFVGGAQSATGYLLRGVRDLITGEIHLITCNTSLSRDEYLERDGIQYHFLSSSGRFRVATRHLEERRKIVRRLRRVSPDLVHGIGTAEYGYAALRSPFPTVVTVHGIKREDARHLPTLSGRLRGWLVHRLFERPVIRRAPHLIATGTSYVERYFGDAIGGAVHRIANPIATPFFEAGRSGPGTFRVLLPARIAPVKGIREAVDAVGRLAGDSDGIELRIAGAVQDQAYFDDVRSNVDNRGLGENVNFLGGLEVEEMVREYARASVMLLPSFQETTPLSIGESMATGTPVVATDVGGVDDLVEDGRTGYLVRPGDVDDMSPIAVDRLFRVAAGIIAVLLLAGCASGPPASPTATPDTEPTTPGGETTDPGDVEPPYFVFENDRAAATLASLHGKDRTWRAATA